MSNTKHAECHGGVPRTIREFHIVWRVVTGQPVCHVVGMLSHQLLQHVIDGKKAIIQNPTETQRFVFSVFTARELREVSVVLSTVNAFDL